MEAKVVRTVCRKSRLKSYVSYAGKEISRRNEGSEYRGGEKKQLERFARSLRFMAASPLPAFHRRFPKLPRNDYARYRRKESKMKSSREETGREVCSVHVAMFNDKDSSKKDRN